MTEWHIQSRAAACQTCEQSFAEGAVYHTLLFEGAEKHQRTDVCETCWGGEQADGGTDRKGFVSHWKGVFRAPPPPPPEAIQKNTAEDLLREIVQRNDPRFEAAAYILSAMLERKRALKVVERLVGNGKAVYVYEHPPTGDVFTIADPGLNLRELEAVQDQVARLLESGLSGEAAPDAAPPGDGDAEAAAEEEA